MMTAPDGEETMTEEQAAHHVIEELRKRQPDWSIDDLGRPASIAMVIKIVLTLTKAETKTT